MSERLRLIIYVAHRDTSQCAIGRYDDVLSIALVIAFLALAGHIKEPTALPRIGRMA